MKMTKAPTILAYKIVGAFHMVTSLLNKFYSTKDTSLKNGLALASNSRP